MSKYIDDLTDNRTLPKTFMRIQWDNEGFEYDKLSDDDFDKLPSIVVIDEKSTLVEDYLSTQYQCLCVYLEDLDDEDELEEVQEDYEKIIQSKNPPKNQSSSCGCC